MVTVTASDGKEMVSDEFAVTVPNRAPVVANAIDAQTVEIGSPVDLDISDVFMDDDMDMLEITSMSSDTMILEANVSGDMLGLTAMMQGDAMVTLTADDGFGGSVMTEFAVTVPTRAPIVANAVADYTSTDEGTPDIDLNNVFSDPDGDPLTFSAMSSDTAVATVSVSGGSLMISTLASGTTTITVTADDMKGGMMTMSFALTVNAVPTATGTIAGQSLEMGGESMTLDLADTFVDTGGDTLSYSASSSNSSSVAVSLSGSSLTIRAVSRGQANVMVSATDSFPSTIEQTFTVSVGDTELKKAAANAMAAAGRSILSNVSLAVGSRVVADHGDSDVTFATFGEVVRDYISSYATKRSSASRTSDPFDQSVNDNASMLDSLDRGADSLTSRRALDSLKRGFAMSFGGSDNGMGAWTVWGSATRGQFEDASYDGNVSSIFMGVDVQLNACYMVGLSISRNTFESDYMYGSASQTLESSVTSFMPYGRAQPDTQTTIWGTFGMGSGELDTTIAGSSATASSDLEMTLGLLGARRELSSLGRTHLAVRGDVGFVNMSTDSGDGAADGLAGDISRVRVGVETNWPTEMENGSVFTPFAELSFRSDGGDGTTGTGFEVAGGLRMNAGNFSLEAQGRVLAQHSSDDYSDSGVSVTANLNPSADGSGLWLSVEPQWGGTSMSTDAIWREDSRYGPNTHSVNQAIRGGTSLGAEFGYGFKVASDRYLVAPYVNYNERYLGSELLFGTRIGQLVYSQYEFNLEMAAGTIQRTDGETGGQAEVRASLRF